MNNFALCFLAYGDEHIDEFNNLVVSHPNIFVLTDDKSKIHNQSINIIQTNEEFNFHLKRYSIEAAFKEYDTVLLLDTDVQVNSLSFMEEIKTDGMYVKWIDPKLTHKDNRLNMYNNEYCIQLNKLNNHSLPIQFIPEYAVILKITDVNKRIEFVRRWGEIHNTIKDFEPTDRHYNLNGAIEGCIMYLTCMDLNIPIIQYGNKLEINHYASHSKFDKRLI